jgi:hypothetical protein
MTVGEAYLDHYERFFRDSTSRASFEHDGASIQVLDFPHAMQGAHIYASIGLTHFQDQLHEVCEVVVPTSVGSDEVSKAVGSSLLFLLMTGAQFAGISYLRHLHRAMPAFHQRYGKSAMAFVDPFPFPIEVAHVPLTGGRAGKLWMGFFLTDGEVAFAERSGVEALTALLEERGVDVVDIDRPSVV